MTLAKRRIDVTITVGDETLVLTGHRVIAEIVNAGGATQGQLSMRIYGLPLAKINQLTMIGPTMTQYRGKNSISVSAGDDGAALSLIYTGQIDQAWGDFQAAPDVCLNITALAALGAALNAVDGTSYKGSADVGQVMSDLAREAGLAFVNHGVNVRLASPVFQRSTLDKIATCAEAARIDYFVDRGTLHIWPKGGARDGDVPLFSAAKGMVGYPLFSSGGIGVQSAFRPDVFLGGKFAVDSTLTVARGEWNVFAVQHSLESERPGGAWFTYVSGYRPPR